ncbi:MULTISPECIES: ribulose-phosphate 3-epimerase [unclassified Hydrogenobaculum]|uniref:ribulose-phosphate 3-epimerase n=1 Tax=unclassified Hydrogenobaculum TaxID=2622382 RepID=UPI0001C506D1|nr:MULTISPECIES: ribulose-phosphate 3-epimerase [unclassified Hydrogenobaculum]AEF19265.1 ribulose-phosphate 3-epimerase [Hydrogenobaculum sp. 3684]AEG46554.1 ribulose-phosphate 3-epimerase [Hydrogenobaculum sp. SHO]AGG15199.1 ribulose-phosphate 3-epimerase [Hydrogenobaculum sp. HO]AGH93497.1 ribulose-phosphate 3-epimerase [Hydrogenobaculum sp. SN]
MKYLAPSILSADFWNLGKDIEATLKGGADIIHFDVMDGAFVPNITVGPYVLERLKEKIPHVTFDAHLMINNPDAYIKEFVEAGASMVSVHIENVPHIHRTVELIKSLGAKAGVAINPGTSLEAIDEIIHYVDYILLMSVNPGFGGQSFIDRSTVRAKSLKQRILEKGLNCLVEMDGGLKFSNLHLVKEYVDIFVIGSGIFKEKDIESITRKIKDFINNV